MLILEIWQKYLVVVVIPCLELEFYISGTVTPAAEGETHIADALMQRIGILAWC